MLGFKVKMAPSVIPLFFGVAVAIKMTKAMVNESATIKWMNNNIVLIKSNLKKLILNLDK